jgi:hypothetical protein
MTKKKKMLLTNGYTFSQNAKRERLLGHLKPSDGTVNKKSPTFDEFDIFICKCGRSNYDHPCLFIGNHYSSMPYYGDLCPFLAIGE